MENLALHIECLIFSANPSISYDDIKDALEESLGTSFADTEISAQIDLLIQKYQKRYVFDRNHRDIRRF